MSKANSSTSETGIPLILFLIFLVLKLCKVISWSWVWVLSPIWISAGLVAVVYIVLFLIALFRKIWEVRI